jgi:predicted Zn-dependent protease
MKLHFSTFLRNVTVTFSVGLESVQSLDMLTINEEFRNREDLVELMWKAFSYFPRGIWEGVNFVGNISVKCDLKIRSKQDVCGAFVFSRLLRKIREMKNALKTEDLLLAMTHDPVIVMYHRFEVDGFKRMVNIVHDYVSNDVGVISLYETDEDAAAKVAAHGLGHNQGLTHHAEPIDLMYAGLLHGRPIRIDGFCNECKRKLKKSG